MAESETYRRGREIRRQLLGDEYVQQAERTTYDDPRMRKFIDLATETVFGSLWARPGLDLKTRTLVDRKSTRLNSSHTVISYAVFCLKKKKNKHKLNT